MNQKKAHAVVPHVLVARFRQSGGSRRLSDDRLRD